MKVSLNWLKDYVRAKGSAESLSNVLTLAGLNVEKLHKINDDFVFEIEITTNRPDWLSHIGVAREIHAVTGGSFALPPAALKRKFDLTRKIKVSIPNHDLCPYYSAVVLEEIEWQDTPEFMKKRLEACGIRSINLIVDITNYVLLEWGQPLHAFDLDLIHGDEITARSGRDGERMTALDGITYELNKNDIIISDSKGAVAIGGVMGGKDSEVSLRSKNILLESAFFKPSSVRQTARRLGLGSESSYRFERRVDPKGVDLARARAVYLISKYAKPKRISPVFHSGKPPVSGSQITLNLSEIMRILGIEIPAAKMKSFLSRLGLDVSARKKSISVRVPSFRADLTRPIDLIEEVARLYGYDKIPETLPDLVPIDTVIQPILNLENKVRSLCVGLGFQEIITFSIVEETILKKLGITQQSVRLVNPQNKELCLMRPTLLSGLAQSVRRNLSVGQTDLWFFEVGNRYTAEDNPLSSDPTDLRTTEPLKRSVSRAGLPHEERMLGMAVSSEGRLSWLDKKRPATFYDLEGVIKEFFHRLGVVSFEIELTDHPFFETGEAVQIKINGTHLGYYGSLSEQVRRLYDLDKLVYYAELSLKKLSQINVKQARFEDFPKFPSSPRDLTLIISDDLKSNVITDRIRKMAGALAVKIEVFDYFKGGQIPKGKKSLSFRIHYQAKDRTLQNEEVNKLHFEIIDSLHHSFGAELPKAKIT